jgi:uncharacterized membrane protein
LALFNRFILFSAYTIGIIVVCGFLMYRMTELEVHRTLILGTLVVGTVIQLFSSVGTLVLALTDAAKDV